MFIHKIRPVAACALQLSARFPIALIQDPLALGKGPRQHAWIHDADLAANQKVLAH
jgi:hypothetical protein